MLMIGVVMARMSDVIDVVMEKCVQRGSWQICSVLVGASCAADGYMQQGI